MMTHEATSRREDDRPPADESLALQLAGDLHDGLLQYVIAARMMNEVVQRRLHAAAVDVPPEVEMVEHYLQQAIAEGRRLIDWLHGNPLTEVDLPDALAALARELSEEGQIKCEFHLEGTIPRDAALRDLLFRIAQEAISNVRRHSQATQARLSLVAGPEQIVLEVTDNGTGFDQEADTAPSGTAPPAGARREFGLAGMRRRVEAAGGRWLIESAPGRGTRVRAEVPLP